MKNTKHLYLSAIIFVAIISCEIEASRNSLKGVTFNHIILEGQSTYKLLENIITYNDILGYDSINHIFQLTDAAGDKIRKEKYPTTPTPFGIAVDGEVIYIANFIPGYSSLSCWECIAVEPYSYDNKYRVQMGYPATYYFTGEDPRNHSKIISKLEEDKKLKTIEK